MSLCASFISSAEATSTMMRFRLSGTVCSRAEQLAARGGDRHDGGVVLIGAEA